MISSRSAAPTSAWRPSTDPKTEPSRCSSIRSTSRKRRSRAFPRWRRRLSTSRTRSKAIRPWIEGVTVRPVVPGYAGHSLHTYFGICPESPDGKSVLVYVSDRPDAHVGQLLRVDRATGKTTALDDSVEVEDSHRQANQQWVAKGQFVVYMNLVDGEWTIVRVDVATGEKKVLAKGRQLGWGQPNSDVVPLYGIHWAPGKHRDLEMLHVRTGKIETLLKADDVVAKYPEFFEQAFGSKDRVFTIFFPTMSPDGKRVFFKVSSPNTGKFRASGASLRHGLFVADLPSGNLRGFLTQWGHPAWFSDSRHILDRHIVVDTDTMKTRRVCWSGRSGLQPWLAGAGRHPGGV